MPNRYIRDAVLDSQRYHSVGPLERLAFLELLLNADDWGLVPIHQVFLSRKTTAFTGLTAEALAAKLAALEGPDLIRTYSVTFSPFAYIPRNGFFIRSKRPKYPLPDFEAIQNVGRFNELKALAQNCIADVVECTAHAQQQWDPTATATETESSTKSSTTPLDHPERSIPCPQQEIVALWTKTLPALRAPRSWGADRQRHLCARWRELLADDEFEDKESGLQWFAWFFDLIGKSTFLTGKVAGGNGKPPFMASLDWVILPSNFAKIIDRKYHSAKENV